MKEDHKERIIKCIPEYDIKNNSVEKRMKHLPETVEPNNLVKKYSSEDEMNNNLSEKHSNLLEYSSEGEIQDLLKIIQDEPVKEKPNTIPIQQTIQNSQYVYHEKNTSAEARKNLDYDFSPSSNPEIDAKVMNLKDLDNLKWKTDSTQEKNTSAEARKNLDYDFSPSSNPATPTIGMRKMDNIKWE